MICQALSEVREVHRALLLVQVVIIPFGKNIGSDRRKGNLSVPDHRSSNGKVPLVGRISPVDPTSEEEDDGPNDQLREFINKPR